jgi:hypothetical protein
MLVIFYSHIASNYTRQSVPSSHLTHKHLTKMTHAHVAVCSYRGLTGPVPVFCEQSNELDLFIHDHKFLDQRGKCMYVYMYIYI